MDPEHTIGPLYYRTEVGAHVNSESPYGTFDQSGNVEEWNEAVVDGSSRGTRGGAYASGYWGLHAAWRNSKDPTSEVSGQVFGFRVAELPPLGACCDGLSGSCTDGVLLDDCRDEKHQWYAGQQCQDIACVTIPAASEWGLVVLTLLVLTAGTVVLARHRRAAAV